MYFTIYYYFHHPHLPHYLRQNIWLDVHPDLKLHLRLLRRFCVALVLLVIFLLSSTLFPGAWNSLVSFFAPSPQVYYLGSLYDFWSNVCQHLPNVFHPLGDFHPLLRCTLHLMISFFWVAVNLLTNRTFSYAYQCSSLRGYAQFVPVGFSSIHSQLCVFMRHWRVYSPSCLVARMSKHFSKREGKQINLVVGSRVVFSNNSRVVGWTNDKILWMIDFKLALREEIQNDLITTSLEVEFNDGIAGSTRVTS